MEAVAVGTEQPTMVSFQPLGGLRTAARRPSGASRRARTGVHVVLVWHFANTRLAELSDVLDRLLEESAVRQAGLPKAERERQASVVPAIRVTIEIRAPPWCTNGSRSAVSRAASMCTDQGQIPS